MKISFHFFGYLEHPQWLHHQKQLYFTSIFTKQQVRFFGMKRFPCFFLHERAPLVVFLKQTWLARGLLKQGVGGVKKTKHMCVQQTLSQVVSFRCVFSSGSSKPRPSSCVSRGPYHEHASTDVDQGATIPRAGQSIKPVVLICWSKRKPLKISGFQSIFPFTHRLFVGKKCPNPVISWWWEGVTTVWTTLGIFWGVPTGFWPTAIYVDFYTHYIISHYTM